MGLIANLEVSLKQINNYFAISVFYHITKNVLKFLK